MENEDTPQAPNNQAPNELSKVNQNITSEIVWEEVILLARNENYIPEGFIKSSLTHVETSFEKNSQFILYAHHHIGRIEQEYGEALNKCLTKACEKWDVEPLELQILKSQLQPELSFTSSPPANGSAPPYAPRTRSDLKPTFTFENFVGGGTSRLPLEACKAVAESPGEIYNPIFIHGDVGLGKTHLLHAVAHYVKEHFPGYEVRYSTTDQFISQFVTAVGKKGGMTDFHRSYRELDLFLLDDIQFFAGKEASKDELFNTLNDLYLSGKQIVLAADRPPAALEDIPQRLVSRFLSGLVIDIKPPDIETRMAILRLKTATQHTKFEISDETYEFIAENFTENIRELEGALTRLIAQANLDNRSYDNTTGSFYINLAYAQNALESMLGPSWGETLTPNLIIEMCADFLHCSIEELTGPRRSQQVTTARHIAMYAMREITDLSFPQIGAIFGGRDHSTVMHAIRKKVEPQLKEDMALLNQVNELLRILRTKDSKFLKTRIAS